MRKIVSGSAFLFSCWILSLAGPGDIPVTRWVSPEGGRPITYEEWRDANPSAPFRIGEVGWEGESDSLVEVMGNLVEVMVNSSIFDSLIFYLDPDSGQYIQDLMDQGYSVRVDTATFSNTLADAESLRAFLQSLYPQGLAGAVLIGDLPVPWYQMMEVFWSPPTYCEFPIDLFYMDLDGIWEDTLQNVGDSLLVPGSDSILDTHYGRMAADIWVGRLTASPLGDEIPILRDYFEKDHAYRSDSLPLPERALVYVDDDWTSWAWQWSNDVGLVYPVRTTVFHPETTVADDYRGRLTHNYEWISVFAHSSPSLHGFVYNSGLSWSWFYADSIPGIDPHSSFYNLFACSNCRYVENGYMGGRYIFTDTWGLGAIGSTKTGSMLEFQNFYYPLSEGKCLGDGFREWFAIWAEAWGDTSRSWFYGMTLLGDPALSVVDSTPGIEEQLANDQLTMTNFQLLQNFPNPFTRVTTICYDLPGNSQTSLEIYDCSGRLVRSLTIKPGVGSVEWDGMTDQGRRAGPGVYFYSLTGRNGLRIVRKMVLLP